MLRSEPTPSCDADADASGSAWTFSIVCHHDTGRGHMETFETCEVHALTGVVRCSEFAPPESWRWIIVGSAVVP